MNAPATAPAQPGRWRTVLLLLLLPGGFLLGVVGGFLTEHRFSVGPVEIPWGSILVVATLIACTRAVSLHFETRAAGGMLFAGWLIGTALLALPNPSGDVVFTFDAATLGYLLGGSALGGAAAAWPLWLGDPAAGPDAGRETFHGAGSADAPGQLEPGAPEVRDD